MRSIQLELLTCPPFLTRFIRITILCFHAVLGFSYSSPAYSEKPDIAADAVSSLRAYAQFKAGNYAEARAIWERLASKGNTTALINLANLFQQGMGVDENDMQALVYVQQAADLGDARAQYELGIEYEKGVLLERDLDQAAMWLKRSASQDNADGQYAYGILLATAYGKGFSQTTLQQREEALMWLKKSRSNGHPDASTYIKLLEKPAEVDQTPDE